MEEEEEENVFHTHNIKIPITYSKEILICEFFFLLYCYF